MKTKLKQSAHKLYTFIVNIIRAGIRLIHKASSKLPLKNVVLFSSIPDFSESSVEVYNQMTTMDEFKGYKFIWFVDNPEAQAERPNTTFKKRIGNPLSRTFANLYRESRARFSIFTHELYGNIYNSQQVRVFIEHGSYGIKTGAGHGNHGKKKGKTINYFDYATYRVRTRGAETKNFRVCGLPRNDRLFDDPSIARGKLGIEAYDKVLIWMPTFKHYQNSSVFSVKRNDYAVEKAADITLQEDSTFYDEVSKTLNAHNALMIIKYHPRQDMKYVISKNTANIKIISDEELLAAGIPLYTLLGATDGLITDFSSVAYDYLLINRPIGFDITDLELYIQGGTVAVKDPLDHMPGEKINDVQTFCDFITKVADGEDHFEAERKRWLDIVHVHQDGNSAKRIVDMLLTHIK